MNTHFETRRANLIGTQSVLVLPPDVFLLQISAILQIRRVAIYSEFTDFKVFVRISLHFDLMKQFTRIDELGHVTADRRDLEKLCSRHPHGDTWCFHIIS